VRKSYSADLIIRINVIRIAAASIARSDSDSSLQHACSTLVQVLCISTTKTFSKPLTLIHQIQFLIDIASAFRLHFTLQPSTISRTLDSHARHAFDAAALETCRDPISTKPKRIKARQNIQSQQ
jgi:hypothetical protein